MQLRFAKAHHQISLKEIWVWLWATGASGNLGLPFNISATAKASDFKFSTQLGFAKAHHKLHPEEKVGWPWARGAPQNFGVLL